MKPRSARKPQNMNSIQTAPAAVSGDAYAMRARVDWASQALKAPLEFANQVFVQPHERTIVLTFMSFTPPIIVGEPSEIEAQAETIGDVLTAECVAKIAITPETCRSLIKIMENNLQKLDNEVKQNGDKN